MLSPLAALLFVWAAVYTYVGAYYCMLHLRRPTQREYLTFGLLSFGLVAWSVGSALLADATNLHDAVFASRVQRVGGFILVAYFADFARELSRRPERWLIRVSYVWCGLGIALDVAGLLVETEPRPSGPAWVLAFGVPRMSPAPTLLGDIMLVGNIAIVGWAIGVLARATHRDPDLRWVMWACSVAVLAGLHDVGTLLFKVRSIRLLEHAALVPMLAVSFMLLRRFVRAADELADRTRELRQSYSELRVTQEELVRKEQLAAAGELSAVIAHEVRNPLAIIKNAASGLRRPSLRSSDRGVLLDILDEEVDRLGRLLRDLLAYARPVEPREQVIDLRQLLTETLHGALAHHDSPRSIELEMEIPSPLAIQGDPDLLRQALANVAGNAVQAMPNGGHLTVRATAARLDSETAVELTFTDTGVGMSEDIRAKAKDPFFTTRPAGTGLGLAIVDRVVKNHGGTLEIDSAPGRGTTVRITLLQERRPGLPRAPRSLGDEEALA